MSSLRLFYRCSVVSKVSPVCCDVCSEYCEIFSVVCLVVSVPSITLIVIFIFVTPSSLHTSLVLTFCHHLHPYSPLYPHSHLPLYPPLHTNLYSYSHPYPLYVLNLILIIILQFLSSSPLLQPALYSYELERVMGAAASSSASASVDRDFQGSIRQVRHTPHSFVHQILSTSAPVLLILLVFSFVSCFLPVEFFLPPSLLFTTPFFLSFPPSSFRPLSIPSLSKSHFPSFLLSSFIRGACNAPFPVQHLPS
jgi:hypothetical protein